MASALRVMVGMSFGWLWLPAWGLGLAAASSSAATVEAIAVADQLQARSVTNPAPDTIVFDGPSGNGRHGAKGILLKGLPVAPNTGSTWTFRYARDAGVYPLQIIHPLRAGQVIVHLQSAGIGISTPKAWIEVGYDNGNNKDLKLTDAFKATFPLKDGTEYQVVSRLSAGGAYEMLIDGNLVASAEVHGAEPLSLEIPEGKSFPKHGRGTLEFKGPNLPLVWSPGWAALFVGPLDGRAVHVCHDLKFYPNFADVAHGIVAALPSPPVAAIPAPPSAPLAPVPDPPAIPAPSVPPTAPAPAAPPVLATIAKPSAAITSSTAELVKANRSNLVFVTTPDGAGSGFIANYGTGTFLITNAHVAAGAKGATFKTLDGSQVQIGAPAVAAGHDIFLMGLKPGGTPLQVMTGVDENATIGDEVVVLGNAEGAGVINMIQGRIVGLGPNLVEVDAPFQPGNSGSPIIHLKTGKVIGVATYLTIRKYDSATKQAVKDPIVRRFGYRLDSVKTWQPVNWQGFYAQATEMESIEKLTKDLVAFLRDLGKEGRINRAAHTNPLIKNRIDTWLEAKSKHLSPRDAAMADQSMLSFLKITCQSDVTAAQQHMTYDYFQRELANQQRERTEISGVFGKIIENVR